MLTRYFAHLDQLAEYTLQNEGDINTFIKRGMYGYNLPFEIREASADYLVTKYPRLKSIFEEVRRVYDSRRLSNHG